jgi:hypothetical protein
VHVVYSPLRRDGQALYVGPSELAKLKLGWNRAIDRTLERSATRARRPLLLRTANPGRHALQAVRLVGQTRDFIRNPGRAIVHTAFRLVARELFRAPGLGRQQPLSPAVMTAARAAGVLLKAPVAKVAVPLSVVRTVFSHALDLGRER